VKITRVAEVLALKGLVEADLALLARGVACVVLVMRF